MKNYRTPRMISECQFPTGTEIVRHHVSKRDAIGGALLAFVIGIVGALLLVHALAN